MQFKEETLPVSFQSYALHQVLGMDMGALKTIITRIGLNCRQGYEINLNILLHKMKILYPSLDNQGMQAYVRNYGGHLRWISFGSISDFEQCNNPQPQVGNGPPGWLDTFISSISNGSVEVKKGSPYKVRRQNQKIRHDAARMKHLDLLEELLAATKDAASSDASSTNPKEPQELKSRKGCTNTLIVHKFNGGDFELPINRVPVTKKQYHQLPRTLPFTSQFGNTMSSRPFRNYNYTSDISMTVLASGILLIQKRTMKDGLCSKNE